MTESFNTTWQLLQLPLVGGLICAVVCCYLGIYVVLRRIVFVSAALTQVGAAGVALGLWLELAPSILGFATLLLAVLVLPLIRQERRLPGESFLGAIYVAASALALIFVAQSPAEEAHLHQILFGELLTVTPVLLAEMAVVAALVLSFHILFFKEILLISFDPDFGASLGLKSQLIDLLFYLSLGLTIAVAIRVAGALLVFSYLVLPAVTSLLICRRIISALILAVVLGMVCSGVALYLSFYHLNLPSGPLIAAFCSVPLPFAFLWAVLREARAGREARTALS